MAHEHDSPSILAPAPPVEVGVRRAILAGALVISIAGALGTAFLPYLLVEHPVLLLVGSSDFRNIALVAPQVNLPTVLVVAIPRRILAMLVTHGLGALYGRSLLGWSARRLPRLSRLLAWIERLFARFGRALLVLWPTYTICVLAGATRTPLRRFVPWMALGQLVHVFFSFYVGGAFSSLTDRLVAALSRHLWESTAVCVAAVATQQVVALIRRRRLARRHRDAEGAAPP